MEFTCKHLQTVSPWVYWENLIKHKIENPPNSFLHFTGLNQANEKAAIDKKLRTCGNLGSGDSYYAWQRLREGARVVDGILKCFSSPPSSHLRAGGEKISRLWPLWGREGVKWLIMLRGNEHTSIITEWIFFKSMVRLLKHIHMYSCRLYPTHFFYKRGRWFFQTIHVKLK